MQSSQSSEIDKYKTTLNFDDLTPNSSLGLLSSQRKNEKYLTERPFKMFTK